MDEPDDDVKSCPVFVTTFKTVSKDDKTVIKSENTKLTQKQNMVVEEVLSEDEATHADDKITGDVQIEEVFDNGKFYLLSILQIIKDGYKIMAVQPIKYSFEISYYFFKKNCFYKKIT